MIGFIDPPGPFSPKPQGQEFLQRMLRLPQNDPQVEAAVRDAREAIAREVSRLKL